MDEMPVTESLQNDIISLFSYLDSVKDPSYRLERHNSATIAGLTLFNNVAILLTTTPSGVYDSMAVLGTIEPSGVSCFILTTQRGPDQNTSEGSSNPQVVPVTPDATNGRKLLDAWSSQQCDVSITKHIQDVFDIITCLQNSENPSQDLLSFWLFTYIRSFRVLASRVLDFQRHWRIAPFCLVQEHIADLIELDEMQVRLLSKFDLSGEKTSHKSYLSHRPDRLYTVDPSNVHLWIRMLVGLYHMLEVKMLPPKSSSGAHDDNSQSDAIPAAVWPPADRIPLICLYIGTLYTLKPIQRHLLSVLRNRKLILVFKEAELEQAADHQASQPLSSITEFVPLTVRHFFKMSIMTMPPEICSTLSFAVHCCATVHCEIALVGQVLKSIDPQCEWNNSDIENLHKTAMSAVVHPEAALMAWASSPASHAFLNVVSLLIDTLLILFDSFFPVPEPHYRVLDSDELCAKFILPETQFRFESWIPPPDIPDRVLLALRDSALQMTRSDSTRPPRSFSLTPMMFAWLDSNTTFKEAMGMAQGNVS
ncbi:hypothetical protein GYMLUDRAFT_57165 [Collybiopsis luxurians FD-317 M1]|uniref:Uncharacterized protein n=1 Tax=Collybiopsis luxurians FD-317 M1 TaxID=944289 RepID=A0A0D0C7L1_9AGAR|nr:hypothetical protein GYMLUDRAFT_57165 [Collybiopsis luxurians FD-317 M1]